MDKIEKIKLIHELYKVHEFLCKKYIENNDKKIYELIVIINKTIKLINE